MDRLHLMTVFVAVAEEEGFAAASRRLGMSPPAVTRCIAALESRLAVKLLSRTTRYVRVTEAGQRYLVDARRIIAEVDEADDAVVGINATPRGHLCVTAPVLFGKMYVLPQIVSYLNSYPDIFINALFLDRVVNLIEEGVDVSIRIGELPDSNLQALPVGSIRRVLCAAPIYLQKHGTPTTPQDLTQHTLISSSSVNPATEWNFRQNNAVTSLRIKPRLIVSTNDAALEAAINGFGITHLMSYQTAPALDVGQLNIVLSDYEMPALPVHVIHREGRHKSARVRSFVDWIVERLRQHPFLSYRGSVSLHFPRQDT